MRTEGKSEGIQENIGNVDVKWFCRF